ncbi:MAG TPA: hypothetical protein VFP61_00605 [Acidimicrobiales bacterium]|nr:hypothetical protein [Acidimicrobiales bacterium]
MRHSELTDDQQRRLGEVLAALVQPFSAEEAMQAAIEAGVVNDRAEIDSSLDDLEDAGVVRQVQQNPPRWEAVADR